MFLPDNVNSAVNGVASALTKMFQLQFFIPVLKFVLPLIRKELPKDTFLQLPFHMPTNTGLSSCEV